MALEIFAKFDGIDGESPVRGHEKEIAVLSYEQGIDAPIAPGGTGGGAVVGRTTFSGVRFRKSVDLASIPLLLACAGGTHLKEARFTFRRGGANAFDFYKVTLEEVLITRMNETASVGAQTPLSFEALTAAAPSDGFLDELTLVFARIRWEYHPQLQTGAAGGAVTGGWDVKANKKL